MLVATKAIVRDVPSSFDKAIQPEGQAAIDVELAREQHGYYCETLMALGLSLIELPADDRFPDSCYVEDAAIVVGDLAVVSRPGAKARRGETKAVEAALKEHKHIQRIAAPATLDGGDVLQIEDHLFVGLTRRTTATAVKQLQQVLSATDTEVVPVEVRDILHLKSACTYLGEGVLVWRPGHFPPEPFDRYETIDVPSREAHAANCLSVNGCVIVPAGAPLTREAIESAGFDTMEIDISESRKAGGGLTCSSIVF